jgi:hypothetical protein
MTRLGLADDGLYIIGIGIEQGDDETLRQAIAGFHQKSGKRARAKRAKLGSGSRAALHLVCRSDLPR